MAGNAQSVRLRRTGNGAADAAPRELTMAEKLARMPKGNETLIREVVNRTNPPFTPNFSTAFRLLMLIRFAGAMYTSVSDCDETYNYWEPLHYLVKGTGFQTWEYSPLFALRSWAYLLPHALPALIVGRFTSYWDKRPAFFAVRISLALLSTFAECRLYRATVERINARAGRYFLAMTIFNAGMWNASTALLPSTFALHLTTLAFSFVLEPVSSTSARRTFLVLLLFTVSALLGWPFAGLLAVPFVLEELSVAGTDLVPPSSRQAWHGSRAKRLIFIGVLCVLLTSIPIVGIDSLAYGRLVFVPWNLVRYNIFASASGRGPELYGTEPWSYYLFNLLLSHNYLFPLAMLAVPAILVTRTIAPLRLHERSLPLKKASDGEQKGNAAGTTTPPWKLLVLRAVPVYIWLAAVWTQPHKEERFLFPVYTLICWNASVALVLMRSWAEELYIKITASPYKAGQSLLFPNLTLSILALTAFLGVGRILALQNYYHAPFDVMHHLQTVEIPRYALSSYPAEYDYLDVDLTSPSAIKTYLNPTRRGGPPQVSFWPIRNDNLTLCLGEQWYRFPTTWLVPEVVKVAFVESGFDGILPRAFDQEKGSFLWRRGGSRAVRQGFNDLNRQERDRYVPKSSCDYALSLELPHRPADTERWGPAAPLSGVEHAVADAAKSGGGLFSNIRRALGNSEGDAAGEVQGAFEKVFCAAFLDNEASSRLTRTLWMPFRRWQDGNRWGELCLLRRPRS